MVSNFKLRNIYSHKIQNKIHKINKSLDILSKYDTINQKGGEYYNLKKIYNKKLNNKLDKLVISSEILLKFDHSIIQHGGDQNRSLDSPGRQYFFINENHTAPQLRTEIDDLYEKIKNSIMIIKEEITKHKTINIELEKKNEEISKNQTMIKELEEKLNDTQNKLDEITKAHDTNKTQIDQKTTELQKTTENTSPSQINQSNATVLKLKQELNILKQDNVKITEMKDKLEKENTIARNAIDGLKKQRDDLDEQNKKLSAELKITQEKLQKIILDHQEKLKVGDIAADHLNKIHTQLSNSALVSGVPTKDTTHNIVHTASDVSLAPMGKHDTKHTNVSLKPMGFSHDTLHSDKDKESNFQEINPIISQKCDKKVKSWLNTIKTSKHPTAEEINKLLKSTKDINQAELLQCLKLYNVQIPTNLIVHKTDKIPVPTPKPTPKPFVIPSPRNPSPPRTITKPLDLKPLDLSKKTPLGSETSIDSFHTPFKKTDSISKKPPLIRSNSLGSVSPTKPTPSPLLKSNSLGSISPTKPKNIQNVANIASKLNKRKDIATKVVNYKTEINNISSALKTDIKEAETITDPKKLDIKIKDIDIKYNILFKELNKLLGVFDNNKRVTATKTKEEVIKQVSSIKRLIDTLKQASSNKKSILTQIYNTVISLST